MFNSVHDHNCNHSYDIIANHSSQEICNSSFMTTPISERIRKNRMRLGLSQEQVASSLGVSRVAVSKWESGNSKNLKHENLLGLSQLFGISVNELLNGKSGSPQAFGENVKPVAIKGHRAVPLISKVPAGDMNLMFDEFAPGGGMDVAMAPETCGSHTFGLIVSGNSMETLFHDGDVIIVDPDVSPRPGDYVVARNHMFEQTFKKYRLKGIDKNGKEIIELVPLNDNYPTISSEDHEIEIIGTVIQHQRTFR